MSEILVKRAIDRSKYPKTMMYVDGQGNICKTTKKQPLTDAEKTARKSARDKKHQEVMAERQNLRQAMQRAKKEARKNPNVENAEAYEEAKADYEMFKGA